MRIFVTGGSGLVGRCLQKKLHEKKVFFSFYKHSINQKNFIQMDITKKEEVFRVMEKFSPDVIIHTAALTNVDKCEVEKETAYSINVTGTKNIAEYAKNYNCKLIYISTDYVFDGEKGFYIEEDIPNPINFYGFTKLEGEKIVSEICNDFIIARTSVVYGVEKNNFLTWILNNLKNNNEIKVVKNQFVSPTLNLDLCEQILSLLEKDCEGYFHTAGGERMSRYEFALSVADFFKLDKKLIVPVNMEDIDWVASRPADSSLNISKISKIKKPYTLIESLEIIERDII
ncbi:MAG TPA: dTDP-4-dehydrorhamnose reductase [Thermoplasmata archaeon]|nr:dTDP-4-dehydrorhamnose reductase [Thermoplasmata archaeon]